MAKKKSNTKGKPRKKTIADRKVAWKSADRASWIRWGLMIPLAVLFVLCTYVFISYNFTGLVCLCLIGVLLFYNVMTWLMKKYPGPTKVVRRIFTVCLCIGLLIVGITEAFILEASFGDPEESCEYIVVLGCHVRPNGPSLTLLDRINAAYDYLNTHPEVIAVVSGGQGFDEPMSEARCMYENLVEMGIDPSRIWMEDRAASTWENLNFSLDLIQEKTGVRPEKVGIVSSEYHLFRASLLADACDLESVGIPATTSVITQRLNHFMREVAGVWHYILLGGNYNA